MNKNYLSFSSILRSCFSGFFLFFAYASVSAQSSDTLLPVADAFVRNGSYAGTNYGRDTSLVVKSSSSSGYSRSSFLKFSLDNVNNISSAKLRIYGRNTDNTSSISISTYGVANDSWTESGITWNNAPVASTSSLSAAAVNDQAKYYELDVTDFVRSEAGGDKIVSFLLKDPAAQNKNLAFNSKENTQNSPRLIVTSTPVVVIADLTLLPQADAFVRNGSYAGINYGRDTSLLVKAPLPQAMPVHLTLNSILTALPK